jgi:hypothetical protein
VRAAAIALVVAIVCPATAAPDDELASATVIFARGSELVQSDGRGKQEQVIAQLPAKLPVRALRSDLRGSTLLADLGGKWYWMALGGTGKLVGLACGDGPAQLSADGGIVLCRDPNSASGSLVIGIKTGRTIPIEIATPGTRVITGAARKLVWTDKTGVWSAPLADLRQKTKVAPEAPLRSFIASPDGSRAFGVYRDYLYEGARKKVPAELLMGFALDGQAARRKAVQHGVPIDWSHDGQYLLVQDGSAACLIRATGGQYKCWKGFTAVSVAPDGSYALVLGNRDGSKQKADKRTQDATEDAADGEAEDDVPVPLPTGELALYAARLAGPHSLAPKLVTKIVDGAAVWLP